jgi:hypothetical protein
MQYAEVRILSPGSVKICSNAVVGTIMPESNLSCACAFSPDVGSMWLASSFLDVTVADNSILC